MFFSKKNLEPTYCEGCGIETNRKHLCKACNKLKEWDINCDGCGEPQARWHYLTHMDSGHYLCDYCIEKGE